MDDILVDAKEWYGIAKEFKVGYPIQGIAQVPEYEYGIELYIDGTVNIAF